MSVAIAKEEAVGLAGVCSERGMKLSSCQTIGSAGIIGGTSRLMRII